MVGRRGHLIRPVRWSLVAGARLKIIQSDTDEENMSLQRHCDACNQPMPDHAGVDHRADIVSPSGRHLANVRLTLNTHTGGEDICLPCMVEAIKGLLRGQEHAAGN